MEKTNETDKAKHYADEWNHELNKLHLIGVNLKNDRLGELCDHVDAIRALVEVAALEYERKQK